MNLDDGMGYDAPHIPKPGRRKPARRQAKPRPWIYPVAGLAGGGAIAALIIAALAPAPAGTPTPAPTPAAAATTTVEAHDHDVAGADRGAWTSANTFLNGWFAKEAESRAKVFEQAAITELADGLKETIPENVPGGHVSHMEVVAATPYSVEFMVTIEDMDEPVALSLTAGHSTGPGTYDWRVTTVERYPA